MCTGEIVKIVGKSGGETRSSHGFAVTGSPVSPASPVASFGGELLAFSGFYLCLPGGDGFADDLLIAFDGFGDFFDRQSVEAHPEELAEHVTTELVGGAGAGVEQQRNPLMPGSFSGGEAM